ncbi:MAG: hypothetical protein HYS86_05430, partial [Candidatus Chisholmbacteria bacterium]|nr:hypothetical protein [Candidatus Chisholmbacteria bacterium]
MIDYFKKHWPVFLLIVTWFIFTWPFWLKGLVPAPLDFLVGFFAPWREHYNIPIKNPAIPDIVNQIIPWKIFTIDQWRQGIVPLWNPYNLAGTPNAANWQSAVFYPANLLPLIFDFITGWSLYILIQPLLAGLFTYLFARSIKLSPLGSLLSALSFSFSGFMTSWLEWGTLGHAILWLPASLWAIEKYLATKKRAYYLINLVTLSLSLLAGHLQVSLYVITVSLAYFYFRSRPLNILTILKGLTLQGVTPFLLVAFQVFPSIELYFHSLRSEAASNDWFRFFLIPVEYLITFVAPDFFGHPVSRNEWGSGSYVEMMGYIGIVPLALALTAIFSWFKKRAKTKAPSVIPFFITLIVLSLLLSLKTPMAELILWLKVPIFASSSPARIIALVSFSLSILGGIGLDHINTQKQRIAQISGIKIIAIGLLLLWLSVLMITFIAPTSLLATNVSIARRNLIIPSFIIILFIAGSYGLWLMYQKKLITSTSFSILNSLFVILLVSGDLYRFHHKFTPYTSRDYWYPNFGIRRTLKAVAQNDRVFGLFDANLNLPFLIKSPEGYDPLLVKNYAELTSAVRSGEPSLPERQSLLTIGKNEPF